MRWASRSTEPRTRWKDRRPQRDPRGWGPAGEWARYWPGSETEPFATFINGVEKYVATSTPLDQEWDNTTVIEGGLVDFVRDLTDRLPARRLPRHPLIPHQPTPAPWERAQLVPLSAQAVQLLRRVGAGVRACTQETVLPSGIGTAMTAPAGIGPSCPQRAAGTGTGPEPAASGSGSAVPQQARHGQAQQAQYLGVARQLPQHLRPRALGRGQLESERPPTRDARPDPPSPTASSGSDTATATGSGENRDTNPAADRPPPAPGRTPPRTPRSNPTGPAGAPCPSSALSRRSFPVGRRPAVPWLSQRERRAGCPRFGSAPHRPRSGWRPIGRRCAKHRRPR